MPAATINRFCSSGLQTIALGAQEIMSGMADVVLAGGVEMMSQVPMSGYHTRLDPEITESYIGMGFTAERVARALEGDARGSGPRGRSAASRRRRARWRDGAFDEQIVPGRRRAGDVERNARSSATTSSFARDELPRPDTTMEGLAKLRPAFKVNGTVTAGNASPYSDGAAAVLLMTADRAEGARAQAARALHHVRGGGRRSGHHGRRADQGGAEGAQARRA